MLNKNRQIIISLMLMFLLGTIVSGNLGTFKQGDCVNIRTIMNTTWVNISTVNYPNSTLAISNKPTSKVGQTFNYTYCNTSMIGTYIYDYFNDKGEVFVNSFDITPNGYEATTSRAIFDLGLIFVLVL